MRYLFFFSLLFLVSSSVYAQPGADYVAAVEERWSSYLDANRDGRYAQMTALTYPPVFTLISREELTARFADNFYHPDLRVDLTAYQLQSVGDPVEFGGDFFLRLDYWVKFRVGFKGNATWDQDFIEATLVEYRNEFGSDYVRFDAAEREIRVRAPRSLVAVLPNALLDWYFLDPGDGRADWIDQLLPDAVKKRADFQFLLK